MTYTSSMPLLIIGTIGASALTHQLPKPMYNIIESKWTDVDIKCLYESQEEIKRDVIPYYPNFSGRMIIHTYASKVHPRRVISGKENSIAFLLTQVNPRLNNYTTTVRKLLSIVETLQNNSVPFYQGIVSKIRTTSHIQEPHYRSSATWDLTVLRKAPHY